MAEKPLLDERKELLKVRDQLLADSHPHRKLDMSTFYCGSTGCIAGWIHMNNKKLCYDHDVYNITGLARLMGHTGFYVFDHSPLSDLFFMESVPGGYANPVSPAQAARAIENYIERGSPHWKEVLADV